jgi:hypothetical protein
MKKIIISAFSLMLILTATVSVAGVNSKSIVAVVADDEKTQIKPEELPEPVKKALAADDYKGWAVTSVYQIKGEATHYEINLSKEKETTVLKFNPEGALVK